MAMPGDQHEIYYGITLSTKANKFGQFIGLEVLASGLGIFLNPICWVQGSPKWIFPMKNKIYAITILSLNYRIESET